MNNFDIKREDTTDGDILLKIKTEDVYEVKKKDENIVVKLERSINSEGADLKPIKKEEKEDECPDVNFETIFLPEVYEGVPVETPFFDYDKYIMRRGLQNEYYEVIEQNGVTNDSNYYNSYNDFYQQQTLSENNQMYENVYAGYISAYNTAANLDISSTTIRLPMNNLINLVPCGQGSYPNTFPTKDIYQHSYRSVKDEEDCICCTSESRNRNETTAYHNTKGIILCGSRIGTEQNYNDQKDSQDNYQKDPHPINENDINNQVQVHNGAKNDNSSNDSFIHVFSKAISSKEDEEAKYKCPLCKRPRAFYSLTAVNNHLKFEHLSMFRNRVNIFTEPVPKMVPQSSKLRTIRKVKHTSSLA